VDLASHQRALLALVETGVLPSASANDVYLREVAESRGLRVVREIVARWEAFDIRRSCPLTAAALDDGGGFDDLVRAVSFGAAGAFVESRAELFLSEVVRREDGVVGRVARFELALALVRRGDPGRHTIDWDRNPAPVLDGLASGRGLDREPSRGRFRTVVAADLPGLVQIEELPEGDSANGF
jgi:hypothetical protein